MKLDLWSLVLWVAGFALNVLLFAVLVVRKRYKTLPWFTFLIGQDVLQTMVLFAVHRFPFVSFYTYWSFEVLDTMLRVMVIWEVARILIQRHLGLNLSDQVRRDWVVFLLMVSLCISFLIFSSPTHNVGEDIVVHVETISTFIVGGLLLMLLSLTFFFRVKVRVHSQAIVYGLSLYMFGKFLVQAVVLLLGLGVMVQAENWLRPVYHVSLVLWIICLWRNEPEHALSDEVYELVRRGRAGINPPLPVSMRQRNSDGAAPGALAASGREQGWSRIF